MTDAVPPLQPHLPPGRARVTLIIAWLAILGAIGYVAASYFLQSRHPALPDADPAHVSSVRLRIVGRYVVGYHLVISRFGVNSEQADRKLIEQVEQEASGPVERLRAVTIVGDLLGQQAAIERLDKVEPKLKDTGLRADARILRSIYESGPDRISPEDHESLIRRHGWFARLALATGRPPSSPEWKAACVPAIRTFVAQVCIVIVALGMLAAGVVLFVLALVRLKDGRLRRLYRPATYPTGPFLEAFAIYLGGFVGVPLVLRRFVPGINVFVLIATAVLPVGLAVIWPLLRGVGVVAWREGLGFYGGGRALREIGSGLFGYIAGTPVLAAGFVVTLILTRVGKAETMHPIVEWIGIGGAGRALGLFLLACAWAPLTEETLFRGAFFHHLRHRWGWLFSAAVVSVAFAAVHPQGWAAMPFLASVAFVLAAIREWRGTILASSAAHALNNGLVLTYLVLALL